MSQAFSTICLRLVSRSHAFCVLLLLRTRALSEGGMADKHEGENAVRVVGFIRTSFDILVASQSYVRATLSGRHLLLSTFAVAEDEFSLPVA